MEARLRGFSAPPTRLSDYNPPIAQPIFPKALSDYLFTQSRVKLRATPSKLLQCFDRLKSNLEPTPSYQDQIEQKHNAVRSFLENSGITAKTKLIGSHQRNTRIQPRPEDDFDIDILVELGEFTHWVQSGGVSPQDAMNRLGGALTSGDRYRAMNPQKDQPTVVFEHANGIIIELVPAYLDMAGHSGNGTLHFPTGRAYWIPIRDVWQLADYDFDADFVTKRNEVGDRWVIPTIKMLKAVKRTFFPGMTSYHLEILAAGLLPMLIARRRQQSQPMSYPALITDFLAEAEPLITVGHKPQGSLSPFVQLEGVSITQTFTGFQAVRKYCQSIATISNENSKIKLWRELFGDPFTISD